MGTNAQAATSNSQTVTVRVEAQVPAASLSQLQGVAHRTTPHSAAEVIVSCYFQINYPHVSVHIPENVNVTGTATCDIPMANIWLVGNLYYNGESYYYNYSYDNVGATSAQVNTFGACYSGSWYAAMQWWIQWPPDATPITPTSGTVASPAQSISC